MSEVIPPEPAKPSQTDGFVLGIETATDVLSVAVNKGEETLAEYTLALPQKHAELLMSTICRVLAEVGLEPGQLNGVALSSGPGSYTGLRIGTSLAKGLCLGLNIPLVGIETPLGLAEQVSFWAKQTNSYIAVWLDARRMEVYHALYSPDLAVEMMPEPTILTSEWVAKTLFRRQRYILIGDGVAKALHLLQQHSGHIHVVRNVRPSAAALARLGYRRLINHGPTALESFEPVYLKPARVLPGTRFDNLKPTVDTLPSSG
jgi:tRNA threonylcarbamoyladenosine biosynthesis protein TsaB